MPDFFTSPEFSGLGSVATIIALILSIVFFAASLARRKLVCRIDPVAMVLVKAGQSSKLSVNFDGLSVSTDVTAKHVTVWNAGRVSIKRAEILRPVQLVMPTGIPILDATIQKVSREVTDASLIQGELQQGKLGLEWTILEKKDGFVVQIIYAGGADAKIAIQGIIEGQISPKMFRLPTQFREDLRWYLLALGIGLLATFIFNHRFANADFPSGIYNVSRTYTETHYKVELVTQFRVWWAFLLWPLFATSVILEVIRGRVPKPPKSIRP